jgi:hypothetical protein
LLKGREEIEEERKQKTSDKTNNNEKGEPADDGRA